MTARRKTHRPAHGATALGDSRARDWSTSRWIVAAGLLAVLAIKLAALVQLASHPLLQPRGVLDDAVYLKLAQRVAAGDLALGPDAYYLSPFYTYFLGAIFAAGGSVFTARLIQTLLGVVAVWLIGSTARRWFGTRAGWLAAAAAALTGLFTFNEILLLQSSVDPFLSALALWALGRALTVTRASAVGVGQASRLPDMTGWKPVLRRSTGGKRVLLTGCAFGLLVLNRPNALAAFVAVAAAWLLTRRSRAGLREAGALVLGLAVVVSPVTIRNRAVSGEWALVTSHGGLNFYIGNHEGADGTWTSLPGISPSIEGQSRDVARVASEALHRPVSAAEASGYYVGLAWRWVREHPAEAFRLWVRKLALTFNATDLALNYSYTYYARDERTILAALVVGPWLLVPLGLVGLAFAFVRLPDAQARPAFRIWAAFVPGYAASLVAFFVASRYRLPLLVALAVGTGAALDGAWAMIQARQRRPLSVWAAAAVALAALALLPLEPDTGRLYERGERIVQLTSAGDDAAAERLLADTEGQYPQRGLLLYRVGRAWQDRGRQDKAAALFERALRADPDAVDIGMSLAEAYRSLGRTADALRAIEAVTQSADASVEDVVAFAAEWLAGGNAGPAERAARVVVHRWPTSSSAHDLLGVTLMLQDKTGEGESELREAVRLDPASATARYHLAQAAAVAGRRDEAVGLLQETLRLRPDYPEARQLLARLGSQ